MFDEIIQEIEELSKPRTITISVPLDNEGYYDRKCPSSECGGLFKVHFDDWRDKVQDPFAFCPFCRYESPADQWHTPEQEEHIRSAALADIMPRFNDAIQTGVDRSRPTEIGSGWFQMSMSLSYTPGDVPIVIPAAATDALRQKFSCDGCGCRYASLGASFFCPACGHNSATSSFDNTLETVRKTVSALVPIQTMLEQTINADTARDAMRQLLEDQFARMVGAFERLNEALFDKLPNASQHARKGAVFQRIDDASQLWQQASGKGYGDFLSTAEMQRMKVLFQRRHVLSHRQGIVDQAYITKSGDVSYAVGQRLVVRDADVLELVELIARLAAALRCLVP